MTQTKMLPELLDQLSCTLENMAQVAATLYNKLCAEGIPEKVASDMTAVWWDYYWRHAFSVLRKE